MARQYSLKTFIRRAPNELLRRYLDERGLGRPLSYDDIKHYQKIVLSLRETRELMTEIDEVILEWPIE